MDFLNEAELYQLTGFKRHSAQIRALRHMGIEHYVRPDGRPCVLQSSLGHSTKTTRVTTPNFEALNG